MVSMGIWPTRTEYAQSTAEGSVMGWDPGAQDPSLQRLHLDKHLLQQQTQGNEKGLEVTTCMCGWDKLWTRC